MHHVYVWSVGPVWYWALLTNDINKYLEVLLRGGGHVYFYKMNGWAVQESAHFRKRQNLAAKRERKIEDRMLSFTQICLIVQPSRTIPSNPMREGWEQCNLNIYVSLQNAGSDSLHVSSTLGLQYECSHRGGRGCHINTPNTPQSYDGAFWPSINNCQLRQQLN